MVVPVPWESWFFFTILTLTIVIANHHHHHHHQHDNSVYLYQRPIEKNSRKPRNESSSFFQDEMSLQLPPIRVPHLRHHHVTHWGPYFENAENDDSAINGIRHVVLHLGTIAMLDCRVAMLSDKTVMWMKRNAERVSLLTVAKSTYSSDLRYSLSFQYPNNWRLAIASVQREDNGLYVCQVNTHPPRMLTTNVTVLAPDIRIVDEAGHEVQDRYYKTGSGVELACVVKASRRVVEKLLPRWLKNGEKIPDHINVYHVNGSEDKVTTRIYIEKVAKSDSGEYTCSFDQHSTSLVHLHVLNGEKQAAVHHDQWNSGKVKRENKKTMILLLIILFSDLLTVANGCNVGSRISNVLF
ncbi:zwei Ig domain protein zig-8 [Athalia rosae]|uniref:zwei Ig domain protein zig-8 n=1 Tax=Athalia rosae TaxID=37344 RepID=UPI002033E41E|nr:zwei Ig domain protein zig-8 [Athalia rosae]XP_048514385.1 zwei Ig domain protein zig-8 [Athalia rosae]